ncbi:uroporphyrinogen-III synthase [Luteimonas sp. 3794]|uniref:uroporphyrinogen-III synthase n=1 Tax=Luteimonas sp. 3794 TaxID=2817730 RepID=UPI002860B107|nr:uroporphyrinogen-III synthase [Luteimonas sp. 3794]MDR6990349.1 uroporphyrinogen-III synthase [Luteimonas sp. 3794]
MHAAPAFPHLAGYYVISLRPAGAHSGLRREAARLGARTFALSPWRIAHRDDADTRAALRDALAADAVIFTSPPAVTAAKALQPLLARDGQPWLAVGAGTAGTLERAGIVGVRAPARMDSEGVLALPELAETRGRRIGLITAPGGRGVIAQALRDAGADLRRADVYARVPTPPSPSRIARLLALPGPWLLPLSSGEALQRTLAALPADAAGRLRQAHVVAASARLADLARDSGFEWIALAADARPVSLLAAAGPERPTS